MRVKLKSIFSFILVFTILFNGLPSVYACGPFTIDPVFSFTKHLDYPITENFDGEIGIVPPSYGRMSLYVFYRRLNNLPFTSAEQSQVTDALNKRIGLGVYMLGDSTKEPETAANAGYNKWVEARSKITGEKSKIETEKERDKYSYSSNCLDDAFATASKTLETRISAYGLNDDTKNWLQGQDAVFSNCGETGKLPEEVSESASDWLKKDRRYQIAAAVFYQDKLPEARGKFEQISADSNSIWQKTAKFVVARTYIREASLIDDTEPDYEEIKNESSANRPSNSMTNITYKTVKSIDDKRKAKIELLNKAAVQLREILNDPSANQFHDSAHRLLNLVYYRTSPDQRRQDLAGSLTSKKGNPDIFNELRDYIWLLDKAENEIGDAGFEADKRELGVKELPDFYSYRLKIRDIRKEVLNEDLSDWLFTYQAADGFPRAYSKWKQTGNLAWFTAAIVKADAKSTQAAELIKEADKIKKNSPAFATVLYSQIRLLIESGRRDEALRKWNENFESGFGKLPVSAQNRFLSLRMSLAANLDEFLKYAQRKAITFSWSDDDNEVGGETNNNEVKVWKDRAMFDNDSVYFINNQMPLSMMARAAQSPQLPEHLKKFFVQAVWVRAFILGNTKIENEFAPLMKKYAGEFAPSVDNYINAKNPADKRAAALLLILRNPVIQPFVPYAQGRGDDKPTAIDSIRGNWWCVDEYSNEESYRSGIKYNLLFSNAQPQFLTDTQSNEAAAETKSIKSSGQSATFLAREAVAFANANPNHPEVPEILHLAVRSTRYGCKDEQTLRFSKAAFDILHKRFPKSPWTAKTPYYFGNQS